MLAAGHTVTLIEHKRKIACGALRRILESCVASDAAAAVVRVPKAAAQ
jgi:hypothetical protein